MPLNISAQAVAEKNKLNSSSSWLILLELIYPGEEPIRLVWNTENIMWDGFEWLAAPFELGEIEESKDGDVPEVPLYVVDIERRITPTIDQYDGGIGAEVIVRIVHSKYLDNEIPEFEDKMEIIDTNIDHLNRVKFQLGAENLTNHRCPPDRFLKGHCRYKTFKGALCGYDGPEEECNRTFTRCRELGNQSRFGGFPGVGAIGVWQ